MPCASSLPGFLLTLLVVFMPAAPPAAAQEADPAAYLPLEVGNTWTFFELYHPTPDPTILDTFFHTYTVTDTLRVNDTLYVQARLPNVLGDTLRADSEGRIWIRIWGRDQLLFDFTLPDSSTYLTNVLSPDEEFPAVVTVKRPVAVDTRAGRFDDAVSFDFDIPEAIDDQSLFTFAPGVGLVDTFSGQGEREQLYEATIAGRVVTGVEAPSARPAPPGRAPKVQVYPNPGSEAVVIEVEQAGPGRARLAGEIGVYDASGREVARLRPAGCEAGRCRYTWAAREHAAGVYFVRAVVAGGMRTVGVTVVR